MKLNGTCLNCKKARAGYCAQHLPEELEPVGAVGSVDETARNLGPSKVRVLETLLSRGLKESLAGVAKRSGVSRATMYRYLDDPLFMAEFHRRVETELTAQRQLVSRALIREAVRGNVAAIRTYFERYGEIISREEISINLPEQTLDMPFMATQMRNPDS